MEEAVSIDCIVDSELVILGVRVHAWRIITIVVCMTICYPGRIGSDAEVDEILDIAREVCTAAYFRMSVCDVGEAEHNDQKYLKSIFSIGE